MHLSDFRILDANESLWLLLISLLILGIILSRTLKMNKKLYIPFILPRYFNGNIEKLVKMNVDRQFLIRLTKSKEKNRSRTTKCHV